MSLIFNEPDSNRLAVRKSDDIGARILIDRTRLWSPRVKYSGCWLSVPCCHFTIRTTTIIITAENHSTGADLPGAAGIRTKKVSANVSAKLIYAVSCQWISVCCRRACMRTAQRTRRSAAWFSYFTQRVVKCEHISTIMSELQRHGWKVFVKVQI